MAWDCCCRRSFSQRKKRIQPSSSSSCPRPTRGNRSEPDPPEAMGPGSRTYRLVRSRAGPIASGGVEVELEALEAPQEVGREELPAAGVGRAAGVEAIDCPYTFSDVKGAVADARYAKRLGYRMKGLVDSAHAKAFNAVFTPSAAELAKARRIVAAFEKARAAGRDRAKVDGALIEVPIYAAAKRLLASDGRS